MWGPWRVLRRGGLCAWDMHPFALESAFLRVLHRVGDERIRGERRVGYRRPCCGYYLSALGAFQSPLLWVPCRIEQFYRFGVRYGYVICFGQWKVTCHFWLEDLRDVCFIVFSFSDSNCKSTQIYAVSKRETFGLSQEQVIALGLVIAPYPSPVGLKVWSPDWQHQSPGKLVRKADLQACSWPTEP